MSPRPPRHPPSRIPLGLTASGRAVLPVAALLTAAWWPAPGFAAPFVPTRDDQVLERVPPRPVAATGPTFATPPPEPARNDPTATAGLVRALLTRARATGDPRDYGRAEALLAPWRVAGGTAAEIWLLSAVVHQHRHRFDAALADLERALALRPNDPEAWLTRAVILMVQGEPEAALRSCRPLTYLAAPLTTAACIAQAVGLGDTAEAGYRRLLRTLLRRPDADPESLRWALTLLAEIATRLGRDAAAEAHFRAALDLLAPPPRPSSQAPPARRLAEPTPAVRDVYLHAAFADFLLERERATEVITLLRGQEADTATLLRLALAERRLGLKQAEAGHRADLAARWRRARQRGEDLHLREAARFELDLRDRPTEALALARRNWDLQREPADARILLRAALAAGAPETARPVLDWMQRHRIRDPGLEIQRRRVEEATTLTNRRASGGQ